ncbi:MAG: NAD(P)/FAD-dependent oxidoreductase [Flavobacteriaceae bacterium]|nr:NAD(P)/FAD-dependent oxidoreductase [Flavobacteriaceae bacterium]
MDFDVLIVGGGAAGMSCALILGSSLKKSYAENRKVGIILHQKTSDLQNALFNNVLGLPAGTKGEVLLKDGPKQLKKLYPKVVQVPKEKVLSVIPELSGFTVKTNNYSYLAKIVVIATGYSKMLKIKGLETYIIPHKKSPASKNRIQLKNEDHLVAPNLYVAGTLAGHRSQFAIACGSGAAVATDILTEWNKGRHTKVHDKLK